MESLLSKMDRKVKFLFIGVAGLLAASLLFLFSTMGSRQALMRDYQAMKETWTRESEALTKKANMALGEKHSLESRLDALQKDFDRISQEKQDLENKYELVNKERDVLINKIKQREAVAETKPPVAEDAYWAGVLREKSGLEIRVTNLKEQLDSLKINLEELKRDKAALEIEVRSLSQEKKDLEGRITYNGKVADDLSFELVREKKDKRQLLDEVKALKNEHAILLRQLKTVNNQRAALEKRVQETEQAKTGLEERLNNMNDMLEYKLSEVMDVKKDLEKIQEGAQMSPPTSKGSIELPPIIVRSAAGGVAAPVTYKGKVVAVNKENNFIIIDLGEEDAVKPGIGFNVYHNSNKIAFVEIIQTRKNVSACDIKQASASINVGDEVR